MSNDELYYIPIVDFQVIHNNLDVFNVVCQVACSPYTAGFMITSEGKPESTEKKTTGLR